MKEEKEEKSSDSKYSEVQDVTRKFFNSVLKKINQPYALKYLLINNDKLRGAVKLQKISDIYQYICKSEIIVFFNEELWDLLDDQAKEILLRQELDKVSVNMDSGKLKLLKPDVVTFSGILKKYGFENVARANQLTELVVDKINQDNAEVETFFEK